MKKLFLLLAVLLITIGVNAQLKGPSLQVNGGTKLTGDKAATDDFYLKTQVDSMSKGHTVLQNLGSSVKTSSKWTTVTDYNAFALADGVLSLTELKKVKTAYTNTSIRFTVRVLGAYTGDNNNRVGLYLRTGDSFSLVASIANNATLWTAAATSVQTITWTSPYSAAANARLYVGFLWNASSTTTAPSLNGIQGNTVTFDTGFTGTTEPLLLQKATGNTDLPASFVIGDCNRSSGAVSILVF